MRISDEMVYRMMASNIALNKEAVYRVQQQITSGRKVNRPSDDPGAFQTIGQVRFDVSHIQQYSRNADHVENDLLNLDSILQEMTDIFHRASELAVRGGDGTSQDFAAMGQEVNQLLESLVALANSSNGGSYVFSGLKTDTKPYDTTTNADGMIDTVTYQGSDKVRQVEIGQGTYVAANIPGTDLTGADGVFQTQTVDLFYNLIQLRDRLLADENITLGETFVANAGTDILTVQNVYTTGSMVKLSSDDTLPAGLSADTTYYAIKVSGTEIRLATSLANARLGTAIDITSAGSGTHTIEQETLKELNATLDHVISTLSIVGAREERIDINRNILNQYDVNLRNVLDQEESLDIAEAMIELSSRQFAYEAALRAASGMLNQSSLMDFI